MVIKQHFFINYRQKVYFIIKLDDPKAKGSPQYLWIEHWRHR